MKPSAYIILLLITSGVTVSLRADTRVVDYNEANQADFRSLQAAYDAAEPGDTLYLAPSGNRYHLEAIDKSITIVGSGYGKAAGVPEGANTESVIDGIETIHANDVFLTGLVFADRVLLRGGTGITFFRNLFLPNFASLDHVEGTVSNLVVVNNVFMRRVSLGGAGAAPPPVNDLYFANNIVEGFDFGFSHGNGKILNNCFDTRREDGSFVFKLSHFSDAGLRSSGQVENNVFFFRSGTFRFGGHELRNNLSIAREGFQPIEDTFAERTSVILDQGEYGERYVLAPGSPAKGAGSDGSDIGIFGGPHPWNLTHRPPIPFISRLDAPTLLGLGDPLTVTVEAQSNN